MKVYCLTRQTIHEDLEVIGIYIDEHLAKRTIEEITDTLSDNSKNIFEIIEYELIEK